MMGPYGYPQGQRRCAPRPSAPPAAGGRSTREERRRKQKNTLLKVTAAALFLLVLMLVLGLSFGPEPAPGEEKPKFAAAYAAGQVYEEVMDRCGDEELARAEADRAYQETLDSLETGGEQWNGN